MAQVTDRLFTAIPEGNGNSDEMLGLAGVTEKTVAVFGTFTATVQLAGTVDEATWVNVGSSVTAAALIQVPEHVKGLRITISGHSSGTAEAQLLGLNQNTA